MVIKMGIETHVMVENPIHIMGERVTIMIFHQIMILKEFAAPSAKPIMRLKSVSVSNVVKEYKIPYVAVGV
jgi:hypothetical protein